MTRNLRYTIALLRKGHRLGYVPRDLAGERLSFLIQVRISRFYKVVPLPFTAKENNCILKRILILGASGFIGQALYKELSPYYATFGTYHSNKNTENKQFYQFDHTQEGIERVLKKVKPKLIISARGPFNDQIEVHQQLIEYIQMFNCRLLFLSSSNVFDAFHNYPSYEFDKTLSESVYGRLKIKIENDMRLPPVRNRTITHDLRTTFA